MGFEEEGNEVSNVFMRTKRGNWMPIGTSPLRWLINMQKKGTPPSFAHLKFPKLCTHPILIEHDRDR